ncbi:atos homolog protein A-like isoform X2 [Tachypleus tridentatus]|uniref:atos homolog protein A-like isoform X2 n=1 Tax=Tachypleus tridentatus TaxID=6853 RepID=UPI003FD48C70
MKWMVCLFSCQCRTPDDNGYREDPHCLPPHGQNRHKNAVTSEIFQQQAVLSKHMLLFWRNGIPISLEVIMHLCCWQSENIEDLDIKTSCDMHTSSVLLEQWNIHMLPKNSSI